MSNTLHLLSLTALCAAAALVLALPVAVLAQRWWFSRPGRFAAAPAGVSAACTPRAEPVPQRRRNNATAVAGGAPAGASPLHRGAASSTLQTLSTGLFNRRVFDLALHCECARVQRTGNRLTLVLLEPDAYEAVCVRSGIRAGDELMCAVATRLQALVRCQDIVCQVGDARLAVLWSDVPVAVARARLDHLRQRLAVLRGAAGGGVPWPAITLSIGMADHAGAASRGLLHRAEVALRVARQSGGARVVCWDRWSEPYSYLAGVDQLPG